MTRVRRIALAVLLGGIALDTLRDDPGPRARLRVDGYEVLAGDFHVHAFVGDGGLAPWMMPWHAVRAGLDVIAVTNHNQTLAGRLGRWAARRSSGALVLVGEEITGTNFHLIAVGIERPVDWDQSARTAIEDVHAQGGVAIAAHPLRGFSEGYDEVALAQLDGVEAAHPDATDPSVLPQFEEFFQRTLLRNPDVAAIGSSDFHLNGPMGYCRTFLLARERTEAAVIDALRDGRTVGRCGEGVLRGKPELVRRLEPHRDALAPPHDDALSLVTSFAAWLALIALAIVGTSRETRFRTERAPAARR